MRSSCGAARRRRGASEALRQARGPHKRAGRRRRAGDAFVLTRWPGGALCSARRLPGAPPTGEARAGSTEALLAHAPPRSSALVSARARACQPPGCPCLHASVRRAPACAVARLSKPRPALTLAAGWPRSLAQRSDPSQRSVHRQRSVRGPGCPRFLSRVSWRRTKVVVVSGALVEFALVSTYLTKF